MFVDGDGKIYRFRCVVDEADRCKGASSHRLKATALSAPSAPLSPSHPQIDQEYDQSVTGFRTHKRSNLGAKQSILGDCLHVNKPMDFGVPCQDLISQHILV
jgi:hypothetical protein